MATVALGLPIFGGGEDEDLDRFIELYKGYLHSLNIDPAAAGGPPAGWEKAMGILRACLKGAAADWYDANILGKRIKLRNILVRAAHGDEVAFKALAANNANCPVNTWLNPSPARTHAAPAGVAANVPVTDVWPDYTLEGNRDIWLNLASMEFTNDPLNHNAVGGAAGAGVVIAGGAGAGHPYVIPTHPCHALIKLRDDYPTQQDARRRLRFGSLFQDNMPIREFYDKIRRGATLLGFGNDIIVNQFLRGLSPDNILEVERIGTERDIVDLVNMLERIEKRKAEMHLGLAKREAMVSQLSPTTTPQEPVILKPITQHAVTREQMDQLLKAQAEHLTTMFQTQNEALKKQVENLTNLQQKHVSDIYPEIDEYEIPDLVEHKYTPRKKLVLKPASREEMLRSRVNRQINKLHRPTLYGDIIEKLDDLTDRLNNLDLRDTDDMDTSNLIRKSHKQHNNENDSDDDLFNIHVTRKKKQ